MELSNVPDVQLLTALTASSDLEELVTSEGKHYQDVDTRPLPKGALQQMFLPSKQWPFLQVGPC
jgi:hypothetical protein